VLPVRPVRGGAIADVDLAEEMLRRFLRRARARRRISTRPRVVVGVPSGITEMERRAVRSSATAAGAKQVYMLPEPLAAAIGIGLPVDTPTGNMIVDIGGGTTEIAVIALGGIICETSIRIAGDDMDAAIVAYVRKHYGLLIGEPTAEAAKIELATAIDDGEPRTTSVSGRDLVSGLPRCIELSSDDVREAIREPIRQIVAAVTRALELTPPELAADVVDHGIVMTGGGALLKGLDLLVSKETGMPVHVADEPLLCVVKGCGKCLDNLDILKRVARNS